MNNGFDSEITMRTLESDPGESAQAIEALKQKVRELGTIPLRCLIYGEWHMPTCCECTSLESVHLYRQNGVHPKITVHLCDTCFNVMPYAAYIREWEPGDQ